MLIEFSVTNYKCFKETQTLSMVASKDNEHPENIFLPNVKGMMKTPLVKSVAIYGANASGKTNFLDALWFMKNFIKDSATKLRPNDKTGVKPFLLDSKSEKNPTEFEIQFIQNGMKYAYGYALDSKRVFEEWLYAWQTSQPQKWFHRHFNTKKKEYIYDWGSYLKGDKKSLEQKTRENNLFLSVAAQFNNFQLKEVYDWFVNNNNFLECSRISNVIYNAQKLQSDINYKNNIINLLKQADLGIQDVKIKVLNKEDFSLPDTISPEIQKEIIEDIEAGRIVDLNFIHLQKNTKKQIFFEPNDESQGTKKFFSLLGPWLDALENGELIFVDEIASSLHPLLTRKLIQLFNSNNNLSNAQLIFTTHDTTQLDLHLFRRDQIWYTEKKADGSSEIYPLTEFKVRKEEALQKGYLAGRYGGIPLLDEEFNLQ